MSFLIYLDHIAIWSSDQYITNVLTYKYSNKLLLFNFFFRAKRNLIIYIIDKK